MGLTWQLRLRLVASLFSNAHEHRKLLLKVHVFVEELVGVGSYLLHRFLLPGAHLLVARRLLAIGSPRVFLALVGLAERVLLVAGRAISLLSI